MGAVTAEAVDNPFVEFVARYRDNPVLFVFEVLGAIPDEWQARVMEDVANGYRRISVRSGHGVGKSTVLSWLAIWYICTRYPVKVVITAPTSAQLFDALWAELKRWLKELPEAMQVLFDVKTDRIELAASRTEAFISARTSRAEQPEALQGVHSDHVMLIGDEASGIPEQVFEAAAGSMSGHNAVTILAGNPVRSSGYFYNTHTRDAHRWRTYRVSCADSSRVSAEYIAEMAATYGEQSNAFRVRVLGEFPLADDNTVIPYELAATARLRDVVAAPTTPWVWGLDVARFGSDASVLCKRQGPVVSPLRSWRGLDLMQLTGAVKAEWDATPRSERPDEILVDVIGLGAGVCDRLRELGLPARGVNVSESSAMGETYVNLRAELWFKMKAWLEQKGCQLPDDEQLINELVSVRYKFTSSGKFQIESKDEMRKRGLGSPDRADALMLTFAGAATAVLYGSAAGSAWSRPIRRGIKGIV